MTTRYGIWRADSPAGIAGFDTEEAALASVQQAAATYRASAVEGWALVRIPSRGEWQTVAEGAALLERARRAEAKILGRPIGHDHTEAIAGAVGRESR